jgi:photosystem II stability/assembly factor-like uncharacterized protein
VGYVANGNGSQIYKTVDGGDNWTLNLSAPFYMRSIEFLDESTGFCGSLDSLLYMTVDSGKTWANISNNINPKPKGICGLATSNDSTIFGCGIFSKPAFIVKSSDRGQNWNYQSLDSLASSLVEIYFVNSDTGFACGMGKPLSQGGVILKTTDGGNSWQNIFSTNTLNDYIWKIQQLDNKNFYASVSSAPTAGNATFLKSSDGGFSWTQNVVSSTHFDIQLIGFIDTLHGWTGGGNALYETVDGGLNWSNITSQIPSAGRFNRFLKTSDSTAFFTGDRIWKYSKSSAVTGRFRTNNRKDIHSIVLNSNPTEKVEFTLNIGQNTAGFLHLLGADGKILEIFKEGTFAKGISHYRTSLNLNPQLVYLSMRLNEGYYSEKIIIE